jgi:regulatory protein
MTDTEELQDEADSVLNTGDERGLRRRIRLKAMDLLARREYGCRELEQRLQRADFPAALIGETCAALQAEGLLSDERFVESFISARRSRGQGPVRIRAELNERGIDEALISAALDPRDPGWLDCLREVHQKRFAGKFPETLSERARQQRFLGYRGFTAEQIRQLFRLDDDS